MKIPRNPWNTFCIHCYDPVAVSYNMKYALCKQCYETLRRKNFINISTSEAYEKDDNNKFVPDKMIHLFDNLYFDKGREVLVHIVSSEDEMPDNEIMHIFKTLHRKRLLFEVCDQDGTIINKCHSYNGDYQVDRNESPTVAMAFIEPVDEETRQRAIAEFNEAVGYKEPVTPEQEEAEKEVDALFSDLKKRKNANKRKD